MSEEQLKNVIVSCHPDDEIIGCFEVIDNPENKPILLYMGNPPQERREEALNLKKELGIQITMFCNAVPPVFLNPSHILYFPDPIYETHPFHRMWGAQGENYLRQGLNVVFYNTNMTAPYIHEVKKIKEKETLLDLIYPSQKDLWKYEKKYIIFEGRYKWLL